MTRVTKAGVTLNYSGEALSNLASVVIFMSATKYTGTEIGEHNFAFDNNGLEGLTAGWAWDKVEEFYGAFQAGQELLFLNNASVPAVCDDPRFRSPPGAMRGYVTKLPGGQDAEERGPYAIANWAFSYLTTDLPVQLCKVDIEQTEINVCRGGANVTLNLTADSYWGSGMAQWSSEPAGISGSGRSISFNPANLTAGLTYTVTARSSSCDDTCLVRVIKVEKIPLGGSANLSKFIIGKVYVPTKWGGELKLTGSNVQLFYTDGSDLDCDTAIKVLKGELDANRVAQGSPCTYDVPENKHGWYYVKILNDASKAISAEFVERGAATTTPWNGWYWPSLNTKNPNLYDDTGSYTPLKDYDSVYGTSERAAEESNFSGGPSWWGHCWGWSLAAIAKTQPGATTKNGVVFNQDEMEGLYTELADGVTDGWIWRVGSLPSNPIPAGPPTAATGEALDSWADDVQNGLRQYIRQQNIAMTADLRDASGGDVSQVWNHDVYKYESTMAEAAGGNEKVIEVTTLITATSDGPAEIPPDGAKREDTYIYVLEYKDGTIDGSSANQNWKSCTGFAPRVLGTVNPVEMNWQGHHCGITKANVDALYP